MNSILLVALTAATIASTAVLPPALPLHLLPHPTISSETNVSAFAPTLLDAPSPNLSLPSLNLQDNRFRAKISIGAPFLPINSALMNMLYFMSLVAGQDFTHKLQPRTYSTPNYRDVQIKTYAWTEARFLLWGVYYAANDMVKYVRFNDVMLELYWEDKLVGVVKIIAKRALSLAGGAGNLTLDLGDQLAQTNLTGSGEGTIQSRSAVVNVIDGDLASLTFSDLNASTAFSLPPSFAVSFQSIADAGRLDRNEVFLTFYTALLHVAQFPPETQMQSFQSVSPSGKLNLLMEKVGIGCQYGSLITAFFYVPRYMTEHSGLGYRETDFLVMLGGELACVGTLVKVLRPVERRG